MYDRKHVAYKCLKEAFRPLINHPVRWLDVDQDFELARESWGVEITRQDWKGFTEQGHHYCAVVEEIELSLWRRSGAIRTALGSWLQ